MKTQQEIQFTTTPSQTRLTAGKVCYQGQLQHNQVLDVAETRRLFAEHMNESEPTSNRFLDMLGTFMQELSAKGYRADFGPFAMGLKLRGSFPAANAPFDERRNSIAVVLTPSAKIKTAASSLKPINVTCEKSRIDCIRQETPPRETYDTIDATGTRTLYVATRNLTVHADAENEGVWIESDLGDRLLSGTVTESSSTRTYATFTDPIAPGLYWLVVRGRVDGSELLTAHHRITAV